jgi:hypothetical protein
VLIVTLNHEPNRKRLMATVNVEARVGPEPWHSESERVHRTISRRWESVQPAPLFVQDFGQLRVITLRPIIAQTGEIDQVDDRHTDRARIRQVGKRG